VDDDETAERIRFVGNITGLEIFGFWPWVSVSVSLIFPLLFSTGARGTNHKISSLF
jgi:hypothetical protein